MPFHRVRIGAKFIHLGKTYTKIALSVGDDASGNGNVFLADYEVDSEAMDPDPEAGFPKWEGFEERQRMRWGKGKKPITPPSEDTGT